MWVNGEKTECWPQELFVVKLHDDDGFSFQDEEYDDDEDDDDDVDVDDDDDEDVDDAPLAIDDDLLEDWVPITTPGSSKSVKPLYFNLTHILIYISVRRGWSRYRPLILGGVVLYHKKKKKKKYIGLLQNAISFFQVWNLKIMHS